MFTAAVSTRSVGAINHSAVPLSAMTRSLAGAVTSEPIRSLAGDRQRRRMNHKTGIFAEQRTATKRLFISIIVGLADVPRGRTNGGRTRGARGVNDGYAVVRVRTGTQRGVGGWGLWRPAWLIL